MGRKRKTEDREERIKRKIRKLQEKLAKSDEEFEYPQENLEDDVIDTCSARAQFDELPPLPETQTPGITSPIPGPSKEVGNIEVCDDEYEKNLDEGILNILGDAPKPETKFGKNIHKDVAARWQEILTKGLSKEIKQAIMTDYLIPANCDLFAAPILNPEAKAAITEPLVKRDYSLFIKQNQIGIALAALSQATELILSNETSVQKLLRPISDAGRLLCDSHFYETKTRRSFVTNAINNSLKDTLISTSRDKYLFGENVTEKLKSAQSIQKSGEALKNPPKVTQTRKNIHVADNRPKRLNYRAPYPKQAGRFDAGQAPPAARFPATRAAAPRRPRSPPLPARAPAAPPARRHQYYRR